MGFPCVYLHLTALAYAPGFFLMLDTEQGTGHPLVKQHGQNGNNGSLHQIQRCHTDHHEGSDIMNAAVDFRTHGNDGIQRHAVKLCKLGKQIDSVEGTAEDGHGQGAQDQTDNGAVLALVGMVPDGCGQHKGTAHHEVGQVAHKGGGGTLQHQLQQDLNALADHSGAGSQVKAAQQHGQFGEVQFIEFRCQEQHGER